MNVPHYYDHFKKALYFQIDFNVAYGSSYHDEIIEYYQYGVKSFFADVGGLLGLLLGVSLLSIYDLAITAVAYMIKSIKNVKKPN